MQCPKCESDLGDIFECKCGWKLGTAAAEPQTPKVPASLVSPGAQPVVPTPQTKSASDLEAQQPTQTLSANDDQPGEPRSADPELKGGQSAKHADNVQGAAQNKPVTQALDPGANSPAQDRSRNVEVKGSKAKRMEVFSGDHATYIKKVEINADGKLEEKGRTKQLPQEKDYRDAVSELPPRPLDLPRFLDGVEGRLQDLKTNRLILVSCADYDIAMSAAYALVEMIDIGQEGREFWLNCEAKMPDNLELSVGLFLKMRNRTKRQSVIVVDATGNNGKIFLDPLIDAKRLEAQHVKYQLKANHLLMVCMTDSAYMANRLPDGLESQYFSSWDIQFLHPLLKHHFPIKHLELQATIEQQRSRGLWSSSDGVFCEEIKALIGKGKLEDELKRKETLPSRTSGDAGTALPIITGDEAQQMIVQATWFACAYFPNLVPRDFQRVVATLLANQTVILTVPSLKTNEQGEAIQIPVQKQLSEIWQQEADPILTLAGLELSRCKESGRVIDFADPSLRTRLRRYYETERWFYLEEQFRKIREHCFLFDRSRRIVESTIALAVDLTLASPDQHEMDWLIDVVCSISQSGSDEDEAPASASASGADDIAGRSYSSVSLLVRRMLERHPHLEPVVNGLFEQLMRSRNQEAVLQIVRRLRFSPQFDFYWVKQLVDRGSEEIRERASRLLSGRLKQQDLGIYETLRSLKSWLPDTERDEAAYSPSNECALLLLIEYCLSSTSEFDARYYGEWPCRYPLLAVLDARSPEADAEAENNLELLAGWLFHPGLESVLNESGTSLVAALVAEWAVILLGREVALKDAERSPATETTNGHSEAGFVLDLLIKRIARSTEPERQKELAQCWVAVTEYLLFLIKNFEGYTSEQRRQLRARRAIILDVTKRFNTFRRQP